MKKTIITFKLAALLSCAVPSLLLAQGSLAPSGVPGPTMKTLTQVEPRTPISSLPLVISNSGSYYLTANLTGIVGTNGITITADNVTIDLNGFALNGVPGSSNGIASTSVANISIYNGTVRNWGAAGINLGSCTRTFMKELRAESNAGVGLAGGTEAQVIDCLSALNSGGGISCGSLALVRNSTCRNNSATGITVQFFSTVIGCVTYVNGATEINVSGNSNIQDCIVSSQSQNGIVVGNGCIVTGNNCSGNGPGAAVTAIRATGGYNRIEANSVSSANRGIKVDSASNVIIKNNAISNGTNYVIVAGNFTGTIVATEAAMNTATNANVNISVP